MSGQNLVSKSAFCAGCQVMGEDDGAVDQLNLTGTGPAVVEGIQNQIPQARQCPAPELAIDACPFVPNSSGRSRYGKPVRAIQNTASTTRRQSEAGRPPPPRTAIRKGSKNAYSASSISKRAKVASAKATLNHALTDLMVWMPLPAAAVYAILFCGC